MTSSFLKREGQEETGSAEHPEAEREESYGLPCQEHEAGSSLCLLLDLSLPLSPSFLGNVSRIGAPRAYRKSTHVSSATRRQESRLTRVGYSGHHPAESRARSISGKGRRGGRRSTLEDPPHGCGACSPPTHLLVNLATAPRALVLGSTGLISSPPDRERRLP